MKCFILRTILYCFVLNEHSNVRVRITARIHGRNFSRIKIDLLERQALPIEIWGRKIIRIRYVTKVFVRDAILFIIYAMHLNL